MLCNIIFINIHAILELSIQRIIHIDSMLVQHRRLSYTFANKTPLNATCKFWNIRNFLPPSAFHMFDI